MRKCLKMKIDRLVVGTLEENCYIVSKDNNCIIIDPGDQFNKIKNFINYNKFNVVAIFVTHYHFDHIGALDECKKEYDYISSKQPEIPYSNIWVAKILADKIPEGSYLHLSIFNSLRSWNFIKIPKTVYTICNVGGFGIDGPMSTVIGATLAHPGTLHFLIIGDLAFFYDLNSLGNRHVNSNLRILLINNGRGTEFRKKDHACAVFGDDADAFMAAAGHFGCQSKTLVRDYVQNLGFDYIQASSKEEFTNHYEDFVRMQKTNKPMVFEVFTDYHDETVAVNAYRHILEDRIADLKNQVKHKIKSILS